MNVVPLRRSRTCAICGESFVQIHSHHRYCHRCVTWHRVGIGIALTRRALRGRR